MDYFEFIKKRKGMSVLAVFFGVALITLSEIQMVLIGKGVVSFSSVALLIIYNLLAIFFYIFGFVLLIFVPLFLTSPGAGQAYNYIFKGILLLGAGVLLFSWWIGKPVAGQEITDNKMLVLVSMAYVSATVLHIRNSEKIFEYGRLPQIRYEFTPTKITFENEGKFPAEDFWATVRVVHPYPEESWSAIKTWFNREIRNPPKEDSIEYTESEIRGGETNEYPLIDYLMERFPEIKANVYGKSPVYYSDKKIKFGLTLSYYYTSDTEFRIPFLPRILMLVTIDESGIRKELGPERIKRFY